ncbi:MAG: histidine kinase N-terminal 7TM domain-containing protein [Chloroflexota bacterium]
MEVRITIITLILIISFLISGGICLYSHLKGYLKGQVYFTLMMASATIYAFSAAVESAATSLESKVLWSQFEYVGVSFSTVFMLHFVLHLINSKRNRLIGFIKYLYLYSFVNLILVWTNDYHHLVWKGFTWNATADNILIYNHGPAYFLFALFSLSLLMVSTLVLAKELKNFPELIKKQVKTLIAGVLAPFFLTILYLIDVTPIEGLDLTTMSLPITGLIFLLGIFRFGLFKIIPTVSSQITSLIPDGIIVMDENNEIVFFNSSAAKILGLKETEFSYQKIIDIQWIYDLITNQISNKRDSEIMIQSDPEKWLEVRTSEIRNEADQFKGNLILMHDMTRRKRLEQQTINLLDELSISNIRMKEANGQKDRIMGIIAHDLRTSFHQVINLSEILHETLEDLSKDELKEYLSDLLKASEEGYKILEELLQWARSQKDSSTGYQKIKVTNSLLQIIGSMQLSLQNKQLTVNIEGNKDLEIENDTNVLNLVLRNLLINAIKFSNKNSEITVKLEEAKDFDTISVIDKGIGIPESDLPKLFNAKSKYTRTGTGGENGSGFGLLLCKEMIERNNGQIEVTSVEGQGSTFAIKFFKTQAYSLS